MAVYTNILRGLCGPAWQPTEIAFAHGRPRRPDELDLLRTRGLSSYSLAFFSCIACSSRFSSSGVSFGRSTLMVSLLIFAVSGNGG